MNKLPVVLPKGLKPGYVQRSRATLQLWHGLLAHLLYQNAPLAVKLLSPAVEAFLAPPKKGNPLAVVPKFTTFIDLDPLWELKGISNLAWLYDGQDRTDCELFRIRLESSTADFENVRLIKNIRPDSDTPIQDHMPAGWLAFCQEQGINLQFLDLPNRVLRGALLKPGADYGFRLSQCDGMNLVLSLQLWCPGWMLTFYIDFNKALQAREAIVAAVNRATPAKD